MSQLQYVLHTHVTGALAVNSWAECICACMDCYARTTSMTMSARYVDAPAPEALGVVCSVHIYILKVVHLLEQNCTKGVAAAASMCSPKYQGLAAHSLHFLDGMGLSCCASTDKAAPQVFAPTQELQAAVHVLPSHFTSAPFFACQCCKAVICVLLFLSASRSSSPSTRAWACSGRRPRTAGC